MRTWSPTPVWVKDDISSNAYRGCWNQSKNANRLLYATRRHPAEVTRKRNSLSSLTWDSNHVSFLCGSIERRALGASAAREITALIFDLICEQESFVFMKTCTKSCKMKNKKSDWPVELTECDSKELCNDPVRPKSAKSYWSFSCKISYHCFG